MSGAQLNSLIDQLLLIAGDYRQDDPERRLTRERAETWLSQFPAAERYDILSETVNLVGHAYVSRGTATNLLKRFVRKDLFGGSTVHSHCKKELARTGWLVTQPESSSQADLLRLLDEVLDDSFEGSPERTGTTKQHATCFSTTPCSPGTPSSTACWLTTTEGQSSTGRRPTRRSG